MIDAEAISAIIKDSLYTSEELISLVGTAEVPPPGALFGEAVMRKFSFHPDRLEKHRDEVVAIIEQLNTNFLAEDQGGTGGWSFLNLAFDKDGIQWGEHVNCDELIAVASALGLAVFPLPQREIWKALPGGMPYVTFRLTKK
jgi:hypothetical protein